MAAVQPAASTMVANGISTSLTEEDKFQISQCERILRFRDEVLAGAHPRIKVPAHLLASKPGVEGRSSASPSSTAVASGRPTVSVENAPKGPRLSNTKGVRASDGRQIANNLLSFQSNAQHSASANAGHRPIADGITEIPSNVSGIPTGPRAGSGKRMSDNSASAQFDPVLLTKSEDLIKAELQLQRQRLERALSDQLQQHRAATKASHASEALADFDLAEVLMKALQLVQSSAPLQTDANLAANTSGAESDSISNDTFYSSKHDTPESHLENRISEPGEVDAEVESWQGREDSPYEPPMVMEASPMPGQPPMPSAVAIMPSTAIHANAAQNQQPRDARVLSNTDYTNLSSIHVARNNGSTGIVQEGTGVPMEIISSQESGEASSSRDSGGGGGRHPPPVQPRLHSVAQQLIEQGFGQRQSPILRAHNLSPFAPQPAHVSPLASAHQPPLAEQFAPLAQATPAQVTALRNENSNGSSPESSPQGRQNKRGKKNKKRKADGMAAKSAASPFIKPEPRSPSPLSAPQFSRPNKRLRQGQNSGHEQGPMRHRIEEPASGAPSATHPSGFYGDDGPDYSSPGGQNSRHAPRPAVVSGSPRYEQYRHDVGPFDTIRYVRRVSPSAHAYSYPASEVRTIRSVSRAAVERPYQFYDSREPSRTVIRPATDRDRSRSPILAEERPPTVMGPPQLPASRVIVDEFGREYIDPSPRPEPVIIRRSIAPRPVYADREEYYDPGRTTTRIIRRSVAPASVHGEPDLIYERAPPPRAASVVPGPGRYDEEVVYREGASPAGYATTRRVVSRPEFAPEYRYYRERDYGTQPPGQPVGEYYETRSAQEHRVPMGEPSRDYIVRSTTVRPELANRPDAVRMPSVRPEVVSGEYGAPIRVDDRQAMPPPRSYSVRPMGPPPPQPPQYVRQWPEYETRQAYGEQELRGDDGGIRYVERAPREVYR